jgi:hypothetical protein
VRPFRATAYRYLPSQDLMLSEADVRAGSSEEPDAPWRRGTPTDPADRAALLIRRAAQFAIDHEQNLRTALRLSLDT